MSGLASILRGIWADVRRGRDLEFYVTVPFAILVIATNLLGQASIKLITSVTLALLTLLVVALLKLRKQSDRLLAAIDVLEQSDNLISRVFRSEHDVEEARALIGDSRNEGWLWGSILANHVAALTPYLELAVARGLTIRVLLLKPAPSDVMTMAAFRAGHADDTELQFELDANLYRLQKAADRISGLRRAIRGA